MPYYRTGEHRSSIAMSNLLPNVVYLGQLDYYTGSDGPTPFYLVLPNGIVQGGRCFVLSAFGKDAAGKKNRPFTSVIPVIAILNDHEFAVKRANDKSDEYYWFLMKSQDDGAKMTVEIFNPKDELVTSIQVERQSKSHP
ncbi:unnamed protein product [Rhizoctonia solani]|uniref:Uncharacterized protein n=1 Tax=Rhizoctonia solani TaxID=456999 RepID=A0A8H2Y0A0_9AGAM|nr:unnamed protein product [Rhizoctonia solani]